jgi:hypothetical protein
MAKRGLKLSARIRSARPITGFLIVMLVFTGPAGAQTVGDRVGADLSSPAETRGQDVLERPAGESITPVSLFADRHLAEVPPFGWVLSSASEASSCTEQRLTASAWSRPCSAVFPQILDGLRVGNSLQPPAGTNTRSRTPGVALTVAGVAMIVGGNVLREAAEPRPDELGRNLAKKVTGVGLMIGGVVFLAAGIWGLVRP